MSDEGEESAMEWLAAWKARALKAEADAAQWSRSASQATAARLKAEEALRVVLNEKSDEACRLIDMANNANLRAREALAECQKVRETMRADRMRAEEALRAAFEAINDDDISGAHLILRTYLAGASP